MRPTDTGPPMTDPENDYRVSQPPPCVGCGMLHGGVNAQLNCLRRTIIAMRVAVLELTAELEPHRKLHREVEELNAKFPSHVKERGK